MVLGKFIKHVPFELDREAGGMKIHMLTFFKHFGLKHKVGLNLDFPTWGVPITKFVLCVFKYFNTSYLSSFSANTPSRPYVCFNDDGVSSLYLYSFYILIVFFYCFFVKE
jgi:hypothetical protein